MVHPFVECFLGYWMGQHPILNLAPFLVNLKGLGRRSQNCRQSDFAENKGRHLRSVLSQVSRNSRLKNLSEWQPALAPEPNKVSKEKYLGPWPKKTFDPRIVNLLFYALVAGLFIEYADYSDNRPFE